MRHFNTRLLFTMLIFMVSITSFAESIYIQAVNAEGVTIYYKKINKTELEVTYRGESSQFHNEYQGNVNIPESVTYNGQT